MLQVECIRAAQEKFGIGKHMTPEQVQWGLEHLDLTQEKLDKLGFGGIMRPVKTSCADHMGTDWARIIQWDGGRSEEHTSELQSLMRISYAVFCLTKKINVITSVTT